jgi:hypothetical protein
MGNLASLLAHCGRGRDVILGDESHIYHYENGGASALGGLVFRPVRTSADGTLPLGARARFGPQRHYYHNAAGRDAWNAQPVRGTWCRPTTSPRFGARGQPATSTGRGFNGGGAGGR